MRDLRPLLGQPLTSGPVGVSLTRAPHAAVVGRGADRFSSAATSVLCWDLKRRAGFRVSRIRPDGTTPGPEDPVVEGECAETVLGPGREHVRVVRVIDEPRRRGFVYATLPRHPLRGEEAFVVVQRDDDAVELRVHTASRPNGPWVVLGSLLVMLRRVILRRYLRALVD